MLVLARFAIPVDEADEFVARVATAVEAMRRRPGHVSSRLARALDDVTAWTLVSEWVSVGSYRRALGHAEVRAAGAALLGSVREEPTAYEVLWDDVTGAQPSDRG